MALVDTVQLRYSSSFLAQITSPDNTGAGVNLTLLAEAVLAVKAEFFDRTGVALDDTTPNQSHLILGCRGVIMTLHEFRGFPSGDAAKTQRAEREAWYDDLYAYAKSSLGGLNWIAPATNSGVSPSLDNAVGQLTRPVFDNTQFRDVLPRDATSSGSDPDAGVP